MSQDHDQIDREGWQQIGWQDVAESTDFCRVEVLSYLTGKRTKHLLVPSCRVLEGIRNGGLKVYNSGREEILGVEQQSLNSLV